MALGWTALGSLVFSVGFGIVYGLRGKTALYAGLGGMIAWCAYSFFLPLSGAILANFWATLIFTVYAEVMSRVLKKPGTIFLIIALLPLVPGTAIFYSMRSLVEGDTQAASHYAMTAFATAGVLALGIILLSSLTKMMFFCLGKRGENLPSLPGRGR